MDRRSLTIGFLAGGWIATLAFVFVPALAGARWLAPARADGGENPTNPGGGQSPNGPNGPRTPGPTVNPLDGPTEARGAVNPGGGTSDSNNTAIALSASIGGGNSAVWYFDTQKQRVLVYQYQTGSRGGLKLLAARHFDFDLKLEAHNDVSEKSRMEMKEAYESAFGDQDGPPAKGPGGLPTKKVEVPGGVK
jgi:hypothetical protein